MRTVVARHCETNYNARMLIQGLIDYELNATGRVQAARLANDVAGHGIALICSSDLKRAKETADIVSAVIGAPVRTDPRLRECSFGSLDGVSHAEFAIRCGWKNLPVAVNPVDADFTPFGGERGRDLLDRQTRFLDELKASLAPGVIPMIVGHGRSLRTLLSSLGHPTDWLRNQGSHMVIDY